MPMTASNSPRSVMSRGAGSPSRTRTSAAVISAERIRMDQAVAWNFDRLTRLRLSMIRPAGRPFTAMPMHAQKAVSAPTVTAHPTAYQLAMPETKNASARNAIAANPAPMAHLGSIVRSMSFSPRRRATEDRMVNRLDLIVNSMASLAVLPRPKGVFSKAKRRRPGMRAQPRTYRPLPAPLHTSPAPSPGEVAWPAPMRRRGRSSGIQARGGYSRGPGRALLAHPARRRPLAG